jgi:hypothetical protein
MSGSREAFESIIATVPKFQPRYQKFLADWQGEPTPWYVAMGELAHHIVEAYEVGNTAQYKELFSAVEVVLHSADRELQNLIWVGLFEHIQNIASHRSFGASVFRPLLGPQSLIAWDEVDRGMQKVSAWASQPKPRWWQFWRLRRSFDSEAVLSRVENPELRRIIEQMYRKHS